MPFADPYEEEPQTLVEAMSRHRWYRFLQRHKLLIHSILMLGVVTPLLLWPGLAAFAVAIAFLFLFGLMYVLIA